MNSTRAFASCLLVVVLSLSSTVSQALTTNDQISPATDGAGLNVRSCADIACTLVKTILDSETGTIIGGGISANGYTWYNVQWSGYTGWSVGIYLHKLLAPDDRVSSDIGLRVRSCADLACSLVATLDSATGTVVGDGVPGAGYLWNKVSWDSGYVGWSASQYLTKIGVAAPSPSPSPSPSPPPPPVTLDTSPVVSLVQSDYTLTEGKNLTFMGSASDDTAIKKIIVYIKHLNGPFVTAYNQTFNAATVDLNQFSFIASNTEAYYGGTGTYEVQFYAYDARNQSNYKQAFITVTTNYSRQIQELQTKLSNIKQSIITKTDSKTQLNSEKSPLATQVSRDTTTLGTFKNQLNTTTDFSPTAPTTTANTFDQPNGCVIVDREEIPSEFPLPGNYQAIAHCYKHGGGKGDVYLLYGFTQTSPASCAAPTVSSFIYPAVVLFVPRTDSTALALSQTVLNSDQATFWIAFYKTALDTNLSTAIANVKASQPTASFEHSGEAELGKIKANYLDFRTELRDHIEDSLYELDGSLTESDVATLMSILSASLGSVPVVQYAKGVVELCTSEDILTSEPVTIADSLWYVIPAAKMLRVYKDLRGTPKVAQLMGNDLASVRAFGKNIVSQSARKSANELGRIGEASVRRSHVIGDKVTVSIPMKSGGRKPDGYSKGKSISEVKNRKSVSCTEQLRDYTDHAKENPPMTFQLFVPIGRKAEMLRNPSFLTGGKCYPVTIIEDVMN